jgi:hypothetical protein
MGEEKREDHQWECQDELANRLLVQFPTYGSQSQAQNTSHNLNQTADWLLGGTGNIPNQQQLLLQQQLYQQQQQSKMDDSSSLVPPSLLLDEKQQQQSQPQPNNNKSANHNRTVSASSDNHFLGNPKRKEVRFIRHVRYYIFAMSALVPFDNANDYRTTALKRVEGKDLTGKVVVVSGANGTLGKEMLLALASVGQKYASTNGRGWSHHSSEQLVARRRQQADQLGRRPQW